MARLAAAWILASIGPVLSSASGCSSGTPDTEPSVAELCVTAPSECPEPAPRYADVAPIILERCASCHTGASGGPWPLDTYVRVTAWASSVQSDLLHCTMPPADSGVVMAEGERELISSWLACDYPK